MANDNEVKRHTECNPNSDINFPYLCRSLLYGLDGCSLWLNSLLFNVLLLPTRVGN